MTDSNVGIKNKEDLGSKFEEPSLYNVVIHNDDYTTMEFVSALLLKEFHKTSEAAAKITMQIHEKGKAIVGTYTKEIAETKQARGMSYAKTSEFPLEITIEKA